jgi:hypothetical protein
MASVLGSHVPVFSGKHPAGAILPELSLQHHAYSERQASETIGDVLILPVSTCFVSATEALATLTARFARHRADPGHDLALGQMPVTHQPFAIARQLLGMAAEQGRKPWH